MSCIWKSWNPVLHSLVAVVVTASLLPTARAQFVQQGGRLVGKGNFIGPAQQGSSVALSADGNTAIVGGPYANYSLFGPLGAAWVYTRSGDVWGQQSDVLLGTGTLTLSGSQQGSSVALSGDGNTAIVGGPEDRGPGGLVGVAQIGAAWVYTRSGGVWNQQGGKLVGTGVVGMPKQGISVALSADGNTAMVGGPVDNSSAGAAWAYTRSGGVWRQQGAKLVGTGAVGSAYQGGSVALSADGNTVIIGGPYDSGNAGAAWVFTRSGGVWRQQGGKLFGTDAVGSAQQGGSVALSADGNTAILGGNYDDNGVGAAWVYTRSGGVWRQQGNKLVGTGAVDGAAQGASVALSGDGNTAIVGGPNDNSAPIVGNFRLGVGAAWVYKRSGGVWNQQGGKLVGCGGVGSAAQGTSVALSGDGNTAILGGPNDNFAPIFGYFTVGAGAAWVFTLDTSAGPLIASGCVLNGASFLPEIAPGTWITIQGANLSATTRSWNSSDFSGSNLPTQLDGVSVTINGKPAYVAYISPTQLNVLTPDDAALGSVPVQVMTALGTSSVVNVSEAALAPALFTFSKQAGKYAAAVRADGAYIGPPNLISGLATVTAKPGDTILLFGTGFGPTSPPVRIGQLINSAPLPNPVTVRIGGVVARTQFAGIVSPGLYQFNLVVPDVPDGDTPISVAIGGSSSQANVFLTIHR